MDVKRAPVLLALVGSLLLGPVAACGDNTDVQRGETNCDADASEAANAQDASCQETGSNEGSG